MKGRIPLKDTLPKRNEVEAKNRWHIEDYYAQDSVWEEVYGQVEAALPELSAYAQHLGESAATLLACLEKNADVSLQLDQLYTYANMRMHEDSANAYYQGLAARAESLLVQYSAAISFLVPAILAIPDDVLADFRMERMEDFAMYDHFFENILRQKAHTLSPVEENLLAKAAELGAAPQNIFTMCNDADMRFGNITDADGDRVTLTKGRYITFLESADRRVRKEAFETLYAAYEKQKNMLAATYAASVKSDVFFAQAKKYGSALEMALADDNIPVSVYDNLIETVHKHLPLLHRYVALRKKILHLDEVHMYDLYAPLVADVQDKISFAEAKETVKKALAVLGKDYQKALEHGMESGWIDVYENEGKRGGAYSWGSYGVHPFVLLNHNDTVNSMFTLAHEMGHALHSWFTWEKQPYLYSGHKIFVAEVASTCNEALLMEYLLKTTKDKNMKKYLVNYFLEQFRGTLFRQTMFAEFEKITHEMVQKGEPLTWEVLNKVYRDLNCLYFGDDIVIDTQIDIEWARIPHFYNAFYVYQYATGYSAAIALSRKILQEGEPAIQAYLDFLSKGDSAYSIDLLKGAGVDMSKTEAIENAMKVFETLLDEMEQF